VLLRVIVGISRIAMPSMRRIFSPWPSLRRI
jgi:hypothetical protein